MELNLQCVLAVPAGHTVTGVSQKVKGDSVVFYVAVLTELDSQANLENTENLTYTFERKHLNG